MENITDINNLTNQFLIALPVLENSIFEHSVSLICRHDAQGAMGLVVNKISDLSLGDILPSLDINASCQECLQVPIFLGGPLYPERGFILHSPLGNWQATLTVSKDVGITSSKDIIAAIANNQGPEHFLITLGCAGWSEGQLEQELMADSWLTSPPDNGILFNSKFADKWRLSAKKLGIDISRISQVTGNA